MKKHLFDFGRLFAAIIAAKGVMYLGYDAINAVTIAAAIPIILEPFKWIIEPS